MTINPTFRGFGIVILVAGLITALRLENVLGVVTMAAGVLAQGF